MSQVKAGKAKVIETVGLADGTPTKDLRRSGREPTVFSNQHGKEITSLFSLTATES